MLLGPFLVADRRMRFRECAFGVFVKLMTLKQNLQASVGQETVAAAFHFCHCLDRRDVTVQQPGCLFEVRLCKQIEWHCWFWVRRGITFVVGSFFYRADQ